MINITAQQFYYLLRSSTDLTLNIIKKLFIIIFVLIFISLASTAVLASTPKITHQLYFLT
jgi:hypothetical protein